MTSLWEAYLAVHPEFDAEQPPVEQFGDSAHMADGLLQLVQSGVKRATAGPMPTDPDEAVPVVGDHWIVANCRAVQSVILRTTDVRIGPLGSVDDSFAWDEGEGDRTRDWWLDAHRSYFRRTGGATLASASGAELDAVETIFERFTVVWPPELAD